MSVCPFINKTPSDTNCTNCYFYGPHAKRHGQNIIQKTDKFDWPIRKNKKGEYIRRERYSGSMSRSFYVGEHVAVEDIHPKYENGILSFTVPKKEQKAVEEKNKFIAIEG